jgi:iron(III) transport system substrate-binding protein
MLAWSGCAAPTQQASSSKLSAGSSTQDPAWQQIVDAAKREGSVLVYGSILMGAEGSTIAEEFKKATGITFDAVEAASGAPLAQRIRTEVQAGQPTADIFSGGSIFVHQIKKEGFFSPVKDQPLPVFKEPDSVWRLHPLAMSADGDIQVFRTSGQYEGHIIVNTNLLPAADYPKSYHELSTDPRYKGKIAYVDPNITGEAAARYVVYGYVGNIWPLRDFWSLYNNQSMLLFPGPSDPGAAAGRGEAAIAIPPNTGTLAQLVKAGAPLKVLSFPDTPIYGDPNTMGALKGGQHPNAALVFINWYLSHDGQDIVSRLQQTRGLRTDVQSYIPDPLRGEVIGGGKKGAISALTPAQSELGSTIHAAGLFKKLPEGLALDEFEGQVNRLIQDWETKNGGPQRDVVTLRE